MPKKIAIALIFTGLACGSPPSPSSPSASPTAPKARASYPALPPPPVVTTAMKGAPDGAALAEARLVPTTCAKANASEIDASLKQMRREVDASFKEWHDEQPDCWEMQRQTHHGRMYAPRAAVEEYSLGEALSEASGGSTAGAPNVPATKPAKAARASTTNNQVASVDEADFVKNDGSYVYIASNGKLRIIEALKPRLVSITELKGTVREMFVEGDRAVVYASLGRHQERCTYGYDCEVAGDGSSTKITVYDIKDRAAPKVTREMELSGSLISARRIGNTVHTVVADGATQEAPWETWPEDLEMCGTPEATVKKKFAALKAKNEAQIRAKANKNTGYPTLHDGTADVSMCTNLLQTALGDGRQYTSVVSFDMTSDKLAPTTATLESRPGAVFAGKDALYLSVPHTRTTTGRWYSSWNGTDEVSDIHKFVIGDKPNTTKYVGTGTVPGHVLNQFSMDEWGGYLRIATTTGRVPDPNVSSAVSIMATAKDGNLVRVGAVDKLAPGEDIRAVRFDDERAYVVTFKKTDPLFVLDLYQPASPRVLGELKIPGFSTYIHRMDPEHLLSIGFDANDHGDFAYFDGVILQMFDVKNPTQPKLVHKEKIGTRGSSSAANTDHLAFNFLAKDGLLAIPMTICEGGGDGTNGDLLAFSGLLVYDVDVERGFKRLGGVDHGKQHGDCGTWWSNASSHVKRSIFLDDLVYSVASDRVKVQRLGHFGTDLADISLAP